METGIYRSIVDSMRFSYSRVSCFGDCRYQWLLKYIYESEDKDMFYASYGSFIHKILEQYYKGELKQGELLSTFLLGFSENVKGDRPSDSIVESYIQKGIDYFTNFKPFPYNTVGVEKKVEFKIGQYDFVGFIDFLGEKDGKLYIVDNKSRDLKPRSKRAKPTVKDRELDDMLKQLYIYAEAVKQEYGKYPEALCFNCFKSGVFIEEPFNEQACKDALEWAENTIEKIKNAEEFYPDIDYFRCRFLCGVHDDCVYYR